MPGSQVDIDDRAFARSLARELKRMELRSEADLARFGILVQNGARVRCPVDTGRLRASIMSTPGRDGRGPYVDIGTNVQYAPYVEYGTMRTRAQPYLRPALMDAARRWSSTMRQG